VEILVPSLDSGAKTTDLPAAAKRRVPNGREIEASSRIAFLQFGEPSLAIPLPPCAIVLPPITKVEKSCR
jgi:hypothetical protein